MKHIVLACFSLSTIYIISYIYTDVKRFIKNVHGEHFLSISKSTKIEYQVEQTAVSTSTPTFDSLHPVRSYENIHSHIIPSLCY